MAEKKPKIIIPCPHCGTAFTKRTILHNYCSRKCSDHAKLPVYNFSTIAELKDHIQKEMQIKKTASFNDNIIEQIVKLTPFLTENKNLKDPTIMPKQRVWHILNDVHTDYIKCTYSQCNNSVNWRTVESKYSQFCGEKCSGLHRFEINTNPKQRKNRNRTKIPIEMSREELKHYIETVHIKGNRVVKLKRNAHNNLLKYTAFLDTEHNNQRIWHILNSTDEIPKCQQCNKHTTWNYNTYEYNQYCSTECMLAGGVPQLKRKTTNLEKYGVDVPSKLPEVKEKIKNTNLRKFGKEYYTQTDEYKVRVKKTCNEKYNSDSVLGSDWFKDIHEKSNIEKYGVAHYYQSQQFKDKMIDNYGATSFMKSEEGVKLFLESMIEKYGYTSYIGQHLSEDQIKLLNDPEHLRKEHHNNKKSMTAIAKSLNVNKETISNKLKLFNIEKKYYYTSIGENEIKSHIKSWGIDIEENTRYLIGKELDIYIPSKNLAIEYCGLFWHSDYMKEDKNVHKIKYDLCKSKGVKLLTIFEDEWIHKPNIVLSKLKHLMNISNDTRIFARKCKVVKVYKEDKLPFFEAFHIQGDGPSSINYGLMYEDELVACMAFIKQHDHYILNRYATSHIIVGGFSKILKHFEQEFNNPKLLSFADLRWSDGALYETTGWKLDKVLKPDYAYVIKDTRYHKFNFRREKLAKMANFDPTLSESKNTENMGIHKIWNCGLLRYTKNY